MKPIKAILLFSILFLVVHTYVSAQNNTSEFNLDQERRFPTSSFFSDQRECWKTTSMRAGYRHVSFLNPKYALYKEQDVIKYTFGLDFTYTKAFYPFSLDIGFFSGNFKVDDSERSYYADHEKYKTTKFRGGSIYLNFFPLPRIAGLNRFISPYLGLGYQWSALKVTAEVKSEDTILGLQNIASHMVKAGTFVSLGNTVFLYAEYRQSLMLLSLYDFNEWATGIGFRF